MLFRSIGSAIDILLLQLAIKADHDFGRDAAKQQLSKNLTIILAVMLPLCVGLWLVLPSFAEVLVPQAFKVEFITLFEALLPGFFAYGMLFFALHQVFFLKQKTWPLGVAAGLALLINIVGILYIHTQNPVIIAHIQSFGMGIALITGCYFSFKILPIRLNFRDISVTLIAVITMAGVTYFTRILPHGLVTLCTAAGIGGAVYIFILFIFDTVGIRTKIMSLRKSKNSNRLLA